MAMKGNAMKIMTGTDGGTYNEVDDLNEATMSNGADNLDITKFSQTFINRLQGLKDVTYSLKGFYKPSDTNGQVVIRTAWLNDSALWIGFLPDGTTGFEQKVVVSSFEISGAVDGVVELSIELEGNDAIAAYSATT
jgi:predicted secreted protein